MNRPDDSSSLIAFVQKHRLTISYSEHLEGWQVDGGVYFSKKKRWDYLPGSRFIVYGKTWTSAVRKALDL